MVTTNIIRADGLVIETAWDELYAGPVKLFISIDPGLHIVGKGITQRALERLSLQSMCPDEMKAIGSLKVVGDWLDKNKPIFRRRPENPDEWYAHVALFFVLAVQAGHSGVSQILANYAGVRPRMSREWIERSRKVGMLTENTTRHHGGRAYGSLTDKARETLAGRLVNQSLPAA